MDFKRNISLSFSPVRLYFRKASAIVSVFVFVVVVVVVVIS